MGKVTRRCRNPAALSADGFSTGETDGSQSTSQSSLCLQQEVNTKETRLTLRYCTLLEQPDSGCITPSNSGIFLYTIIFYLLLCIIGSLQGPHQLFFMQAIYPNRDKETCLNYITSTETITFVLTVVTVQFELYQGIRRFYGWENVMPKERLVWLRCKAVWIFPLRSTLELF